MGLSLFLGTNLDDSFNPKTITANQMALQAPPISAGQQQKAMSGAEDLHVAGMYSTDLQKAAARGTKQV